MAALAADKGLPEEFLKALDVDQISPDTVKITYLLEDGSPAAKQRIRKALKAKDGSRWTRGKKKPVPYGLWRLAEARKAGYLVLVEGESDCWTLWYHGFPALGIPGADMTEKLSLEHIRDISRLYVVREPDKGGDTFTAGIAKRLAGWKTWQGKAYQVRLHDLTGAKDPNDLHKQNPEKFKAKFEAALEAAELLEVPKAPEAEDAAGAEKEKATQAQLLIELAADAGLFHTPDMDCFATIFVDSHKETWPIKAKGFRRWLVRRFYEQEDKPPGAQALQDALGVLEAKAQFDGPEVAVYTRLAEKDGAIYLDLADEAWQAVEITATGWRVVANPPVKFRRAKGMLPLPVPVAGGSIDELRQFVNVPDEASWRLLVANLVAALRPTGPYPVLLLQGEQGSAKSTTARVVRELVDPATAALRTVPRDERDLAIAASNGWCMAFDNLSGIPNWLSDAICRLAIGLGFSTRTLYENDEETIFSAMRPVVLNGIDDLASRQDLLDRALILTLPPITEEARRDEATFWREFEAARPLILGALLDAVSVGLKNIDNVKLDRLPRMADFARWVVACEPALPWEAGGFMEAYMGNRTEAVELALEADPVAVAVKALLTKEGAWQGTASDLLPVLARFVPESTEKTKAWPKTAKALGNRLRRAATFLRQTNIEVEFDREPHSGKRTIRISTQKTVTNVTNVTQDPQSVAAQGKYRVTTRVTLSGPGDDVVTLMSPVEALRHNDGDNGDDGDNEMRTYSKDREVGEI